LFHCDGVQVVPLVEGRRTVIGRFPPADVTLRDSSLSRQHASVELQRGALWVEDLQSTNGTWVNGERVERSRVEVGAELSFGAVSASVLIDTDGTDASLQSEGHDRFQLELVAELARARAFNRKVALLLLQGARATKGAAGQWFVRLRALLRPFDRVAVYCCDTVEVLLPEADGQAAFDTAQKLIAGAGVERCGIGVFPDQAVSADELIEAARTALQGATTSAPIQTVESAPCARQTAGESRSAGLVARAPAMLAVLDTIARVASSTIPVLILGETGTGKELVARAIHQQGKRRDQPLKCINCGSIPSQLVESTLFGHEKGAFTGADARAKGMFEAAHGGTVFLDEIGELPLAAQAALLRVLETKRVTRVGGDTEIEVDVRVVAATHRDLEAMRSEGRFREDLLYRLNAMPIQLPPLRQRPEEIEPLAEEFVAEASRANERDIRGIDAAALTLLKRHSWPGNVRELRNAMERAVVIAQERVITVDDLPERVRALAPQRVASASPAVSVPAPDPAGGTADMRTELQRHEAELIVRALEQTGGNRQEAARLLGLPLRTLANKIKKLGIKRAGFVTEPEE
jgi:DNA-binding NtrC family response regulator